MFPLERSLIVLLSLFLPFTVIVLKDPFFPVRSSLLAAYWISYPWALLSFTVHFHFNLTALLLEFEAEFGTDENEGCICVTFPTFRLTWKGNRSKGRKTRFIFSTLDGLPRLWINGRPVPSAEMEAEKGDFGTIQVRNLAGEMVALRHLVLWRGEIWEDFSANYHNFTKKEKNLVAFDCGSEYYIIGNNLFVSEDSRVWGGISPRQILGRATLINNE